MFVKPLRCGVVARAGERGARRVERGDVRRIAREMQRERAVIREAVERAAARDAAGEHAILSLVEECAGLLSVPRSGEVAHAVLHDFDLARHIAGEELGGAGESFLGAHGGVVAREDALGCEELDAARRRSVRERLRVPALRSWTTSHRS